MWCGLLLRFFGRDRTECADHALSHREKFSTPSYIHEKEKGNLLNPSPEWYLIAPKIQFCSLKLWSFLTLLDIKCIKLWCAANYCKFFFIDSYQWKKKLKHKTYSKKICFIKNQSAIFCCILMTIFSSILCHSRWRFK